MQDADRDILTQSISAALEKHKADNDGHTLLTSSPSKEVLGILTDGVERCSAYREVQGQALFSADSGIVLHASTLAIHLFYKAMAGTDTAADWLIRVLTTKEAEGFFKAAIWGLGKL